MKNAQIASTNPAMNNSAILTELRRLFLQMLDVPLLGEGGAMEEADLTDLKKPKAPKLKLDIASAVGRIIQFIEHAFEWPQMTYRLYPYYWKAEASWPQALTTGDGDPPFAEFLRSGSTRIVTPVRPGFERAVCHYLGVNPPLPWQAGTPPIVETEPYLSIAEELKSSQTSAIQPIRIDKPWIVRMPTTLIHLQDSSNLPVFRQPTITTGTKVRVVLERIKIIDDSDPPLKGSGDIDFDVLVRTSNYGGFERRIRLPQQGQYEASSGETLEINEVIFEGLVENHLEIRINAMERDTIDPDDDLGSYIKTFVGEVNSWLGSYSPEGQNPDPEQPSMWNIYYRIEQG